MQAQSLAPPKRKPNWFCVHGNSLYAKSAGFAVTRALLGLKCTKTRLLK
jgi:hypothetical protein